MPIHRMCLSVQWPKRHRQQFSAWTAAGEQTLLGVDEFLKAGRRIPLGLFAKPWFGGWCADNGVPFLAASKVVGDRLLPQFSEALVAVMRNVEMPWCWVVCDVWTLSSSSTWKETRWAWMGPWWSEKRFVSVS